MSASAYAVVNIVARLGWAATTLALAVVLPLTEYGRFAFVQLLSALLAPLVFGAFSNIIVGRLGAAEADRQHLIAVASCLYAVLVAGLVLAGIGVAAATNMLQLDPTGTFAVAAWALAASVSPIAGGMLVAQRSYGQAAVLALSQPAAYASLWLLIGGHSGVLASLCAASGLLVPSVIVLLLKGITQRRGQMISPLELAKLHGHALIINATGIPFLLLLWLVLLHISHVGGEIAVARYGLANQFYALIMFLPPSVSGIIITRIARHDVRAGTRLVYLSSAAFVGLGFLGAVFTLSTLQYAGGWLPTVLIEARWEITLGVLLGGFFAGRSPFAWINALENRAASEAGAGIASAAVLAPVLMFESLGAIEALAARIGAAVVGLCLSASIFHIRGRIGPQATRQASETT